LSLEPCVTSRYFLAGADRLSPQQGRVARRQNTEAKPMAASASGAQWARARPRPNPARPRARAATALTHWKRRSGSASTVALSTAKMVAIGSHLARPRARSRRRQVPVSASRARIAAPLSASCCQIKQDRCADCCPHCNQNCPCRRANSGREPWSRFSLAPSFAPFTCFKISFDPFQVHIECDDLRS
jgi:hypothetical protein